MYQWSESSWIFWILKAFEKFSAMLWSWLTILLDILRFSWIFRPRKIWCWVFKSFHLRIQAVYGSLCRVFKNIQECCPAKSFEFPNFSPQLVLNFQTFSLKTPRILWWKFDRVFLSSHSFVMWFSHFSTYKKRYCILGGNKNKRSRAGVWAEKNWNSNVFAQRSLRVWETLRLRVAESQATRAMDVTLCFPMCV